MECLQISFLKGIDIGNICLHIIIPLMGNIKRNRQIFKCRKTFTDTLISKLNQFF